MKENCYDVIVLGLGTMGSATCYHLAKRGLRVLGLEQYSIGHSRGSSHGETRMIRRAYFENPDYVPLLNRAYELWDELQHRMDSKLLVRNGLAIFANPESSVVYRGTLASARKYGIPMQEYSRQEALERFPAYVSRTDHCAILEPGAGYLHAERSVLAHAMIARQFGAELRESEQVLGFTASGNGVSVRTTRATYSSAKLVVSGGSWNTKLLHSLDLPLSINRVFLYWFEAGLEHAKNDLPNFLFDLGDEFFYGFPMLDGKTIKIAGHYSKDPIFSPEDKDARSKAR